jgi:2-polyprenyl-3-methyl-5-hydroxy-6-metoxy-1,4-benzoquinol methylase
MTDYLDYLETISSTRTFKQKLRRAESNFGKYLRPGQTALEVGPGRGEFLTLLARRGITDVDVIEQDATVGRHIAEHFKVRRNWSLAVEDLNTIADQLRDYDLIMLLQVMEHVRQEKLPEVLRLLHARLKPGGHLIIVVPNGGNPLGIVERYADLTHRTVFTENSLRQLVAAADIKDGDIEIRGYRIPPVPPVNLLRIVIQKCLHALLLAMLIANGGNYYRTLDPNICLILTRRPKE